MRQLNSKLTEIPIPNFLLRKMTFLALVPDALKKGIMLGLFVYLFGFTFTQSVAQCDNSSATYTASPQFFGGAFGQSIVANSSCLMGSTFTEFAYEYAGNSPYNLILEIFDGQSTNSADRRYVQTDIFLPPGNFGSTASIALGNGTGNLSFIDGNTYTFLFTVTGGAPSIRLSNDEIAGQAYSSLSGGFQSGQDMLFKVNGADCSNFTDNLSATAAYSPQYFGGAFGQSMLIDESCFTGNTFTEFSFAYAGNSGPRVTLEIFDGQSIDPANRLYVQAENSFPPGNFNSVATIQLGSGTGNLQVIPGRVYTFLLTVTGGSPVVRFSDDEVPGQAYSSLDGGFMSNRDMLFNVTNGDCSNYLDNLSATAAYSPQYFGGAFGQSMLIDESCFTGNTFTEFSFAYAGNSGPRVTLEIFDGQSIDPANRLYVQAENSFPPGNFNSVATIQLGSGTGNLQVIPGRVYTFLLTVTGGSPVVRFSDDEVPGQAYSSLDGGFMSNRDMLFNVTSGDCSNFTCNLPATSVPTPNSQLFSGDAFGQSVLIDSDCFTDNAFTEFSYEHQGNSPYTVTLEIFEGQSTAPGNLRYTQANHAVPPGNFGGIASITLAGGTGTLVAEHGKVYTFLLTLNGGNQIIRYSADAGPGQGYNSLNSGFQSDRDMVFKINGNISCVLSDNTAPVITLNGDNPQKVCLGSAYVEAGATRTDDCEITDMVAASGSVDVNTLGSYMIIYAVSDVAGNTASASRIVNVVGPLPLVQENCPNNNPTCNQIRLNVCPYQFAPDLNATAMANAAYVSGASLSWYDFNGQNNPMGSLLASSPAIDMDAPKTTTNAWVTQTFDGCESAPTQFRVRVKADKDPGLTLDFTGVTLPTCGGASIDFLSAVSGASSNVSGFMFYEGKPNQGGTLLTSTGGATIANVNDPYFYAPLANGTNDYYVQSIMSNGNQCGGEASDEASLSFAQAIIVSTSTTINGVAGPTFTTLNPSLTVDNNDLITLNFTSLNTTNFFIRGIIGRGFDVRSVTTNSMTLIAFNDNLTPNSFTIRAYAYNGSCAGDVLDFLIHVNPCTTCRSTEKDVNTVSLDASQVNTNDVSLNWDVEFKVDLERILVQKEITPGYFETIHTDVFTGNGNYRYIDRNGMSDVNRYRIVLMTTEGGGIMSNEVEVRGMKYTSLSAFSIFPNPTTDRIQIEALFPMEETFNWQLTDMIGKTVMNGSMQEAEMSLDLSRLPNGVYQFVTTSKEGARTINRIIKQ